MPEPRLAESAARPSPRPLRHVTTWFDHHLYSFVASLGRVARKPWSTILTVGVMAVAPDQRVPQAADRCGSGAGTRGNIARAQRHWPGATAHTRAGTGGTACG